MIGSVVVGIWALVFLLAFLQGQVDNFISSMIENETSHIQIHHPTFKEDFEPGLFMMGVDTAIADLSAFQGVKSVTSRVIVNGMLASANAAQPVMLVGIDPMREESVRKIQDKVIEGEIPQAGRTPQVLISERMATKLKANLRSRLVMTYQTVDGDISTTAFRVAGTYRTPSKINDELIVYGLMHYISGLVGLPDAGAHQIAILVDDFDNTDAIAAKLSAHYPQWMVETYKQIAPSLELFNSQVQINIIIMTSIFMLALVFGIINTMLMAVLERIRELGMLMAVGMSRTKVFIMVVYETIFIAALGAPLGILAGLVTVGYFNRRGIDLSLWRRALEEFGLSDLVRPSVEAGTYWTITIAIFLTAVVASIYPALKAIRLQPVEALRKI